MGRYACLFHLLLACAACGPQPANVQSEEVISPVTSSASHSLKQAKFPPSQSFLPIDQHNLFLALENMRQDRLDHPQRQRIPIFVITCDRITVLIKSLLSYATRLDSPIDIVIHDNHTTYPPTIDFINRLEDAGVKVFRNDVDVLHDTTLSNLSETIARWYQNNDSPYYVVTDPDIEIDDGTEDTLSVLGHLLDTHPNMTVVGPMLRFDDLPDVYPLKQAAINESLRVHGGKPPMAIKWNGKNIGIKYGWIDTAFGMYRKSFKFHNYNQALLIDGMYQARHLDWYLDPRKLSDDQRFYLRKNNPVGHWSSTWLKPSM